MGLEYEVVGDSETVAGEKDVIAEREGKCGHEKTSAEWKRPQDYLNNLFLSSFLYNCVSA